MSTILAEILWAAFVAEHNLPFTIMEHLPQAAAKAYPDSKIAADVACGRKKTTAITKHVIGSENFLNICEDLRNNKFSLIIDESTDRSCKKHLCLVVRYMKNGIIKDKFFDLIQLQDATANSLYQIIVDKFAENRIPYKDNLIGFASDGANVIMGAHHSVISLLKNDVPSLFIMKCICHSFHLCASYACQKLPRFVEDVTRDIYNYFSSSPKRVGEFVEFQIFANVKIHKILHPCQTRWLSVHKVVKRILEQYGALYLYFNDAVMKKNDILAAENIFAKLQDPTTKLFLQFLDFILPLFNQLNLEMQSESPKIHVVYKNICNVLRTIYECFLKRNYIQSTEIENIDPKNPHNYVKLEDLYLGANVVLTINNLNAEQLHFFRCRCLDFLIEGCVQIHNRFPLKNNNLKKMTFLNPEEVKRGNINSLVDVVRLFPNLVKNAELQAIDTEWRLLRNNSELNKLDNDIQVFWHQVTSMKLGNNEMAFPVLSRFVQNILCLPHSSANVERQFSAINLMKTKVRSKLETDTIRGLLHSKQYITNDDKNCHTFDINNKLVEKMTDRILKNLDEEK
jgi:hypothetical protein